MSRERMRCPVSVSISDERLCCVREEREEKKMEKIWREIIIKKKRNAEIVLSSVVHAYGTLSDIQMCKLHQGPSVNSAG